MQIPNRKKTIFLTGSTKVAGTGATKTTSRRCLDAAHGNGVAPIVARERPRQIGLSPETACRDVIAGKCGGGPTTLGHADAFQGSRITHAEARSRCKAIAMRNAAEGAKQWFKGCRTQPAGHACGPPLREAAARTAPRAERRQQQKREPPNGDSLKNAAERPTRGSDRKQESSCCSRSRKAEADSGTTYSPARP